MKRSLSLLLALLLVISLLTLLACASNTPDAPSVDPDEPSTPDDTPDAPKDPANERIPLELPDRYYGGETPVHILQWTVGNDVEAGTGWVPWEEGDVAEYSDDMMQSAVFARNAWVEEQLGVVITSEYVTVESGSFQNRMHQDLSTTANEIQLATLRARTIMPLVEAGLYYDMNEFAGEILHTDQPWWPADAVASYTLGNSLFVCATEMLLRDKGATEAMFFNTKLANDHGLTMLYDYVEIGDWTVEFMIDACAVVSTSLDGDGLINSAEDVWGLEGQSRPYMLFIGGGYKFAHVDEDGYIAYDFGSKETILAMQSIYEDVIYADWNYTGIKPVKDCPENGLFTVDKALFSGAQVKSGLVQYGNMETEYGILPVPMLEYGQDSYYSWVSCHGDSTVGIPAGATDPEMCAMVLEMLSYEGYYSVRPLLYENLLLYRMAKSEESKRCVEIVFDTRTYDPGQYWDDEYALQGTIFHLSKSGNANIASVWDSWERFTMAQMDKVNDFIDESRE